MKLESLDKGNIRIISILVTFWKTIKPFLSDMIKSTLKITLIDNYEIVKTNFIMKKKLKSFLLKIVSDIKIPDLSNGDSLAEHIQELVL